MRLQQALMVALLAWAVVATVVAANYYSAYASALRDLEEARSRCSQLESLLSEAQAKAASVAKRYADLRAKLVNVSLAIDYGNGTVVWYNGTLVPKGSTLLSLTVLLAEVEYKVYPGMGVYITSINGVSERIVVAGKEGYSWLWFVYSESEGKWAMGTTAADKYELRDGDLLMWKYSHWKF